MKQDIWIASFQGETQVHVVASTGLVELCDRTGVSYHTASKQEGEYFQIRQKGSTKAEPTREWTFQKVYLFKVRGRGKKRFT